AADDLVHRVLDAVAAEHHELEGTNQVLVQRLPELGDGLTLELDRTRRGLCGLLRSLAGLLLPATRLTALLGGLLARAARRLLGTARLLRARCSLLRRP